VGGDAAGGSEGAAGGGQAEERGVKRGREQGGAKARREGVDGSEKVPGGNVVGDRGHG
jgi:hypothetical protein